MSDIFLEHDSDSMIDDICKNHRSDLDDISGYVSDIIDLIDKAGEEDADIQALLVDAARIKSDIEYKSTDLLYEGISDGMYGGAEITGDEIMSLNSNDDDGLIQIIQNDMRYFDYIVNPSEDVRAIKQFKEDL